MSNTVAENPGSVCLDAHIGFQHNKWLAENIKEVDQSVKTMLNLIKDGGFLCGENDEMYYEKRPELIAHVKGLHHMYSSLAERYDHLSGELCSNAQMQNIAISHPASGQDSPLVTPDQKMGSNKFGKQVAGFNLSLSSADGSSDFSEKAGSEISSSASDSESEPFYSLANNNSDLHVNVHKKGAYTTLLRRVTKFEEELKESNRKLQLSEEEITRLKGELKNKEAVCVIIDNLQAELESAQGEIKMREADLETEKTKVLKLQKEAVELEKIKAKLELEKRMVFKLKEKITRQEAEVSDRDQEIENLKITLCDAQRTFSLEKAKLECDISIMSEQLTLLKARVEESELRGEYLENEIRQCEAEKIKMKCLYETEKTGLWDEIERLKADVFERGELVEALNKNVDIIRLKYDMLMAEKDELNAKVQTLNADMISRNNQMGELEELYNRKCTEWCELIEKSGRANDLVNELKMKVGELEEEVDKQRVVISDRGEEKREAIRQLCFSLEHYRSGYQELRQAVVGQKRRAILAP